jgi:hypothetical protein
MDDHSERGGKVGVTVAVPEWWNKMRVSGERSGSFRDVMATL